MRGRRRRLWNVPRVWLAHAAGTVAGYALIYLCALVDWVPSYSDGRWWRYGCRGCRWGIAKAGFNVLPPQGRHR